LEWADSWSDEDKNRGRVVRGGSWIISHRRARVSIRFMRYPYHRLYFVGCRVVSPFISCF
jgi:formylglycine-generating enzyme required for sulfatase activity